MKTINKVGLFHPRTGIQPLDVQITLQLLAMPENHSFGMGRVPILESL
jgi:hypothetical protein